jgi:ATP-dependent RNA helicase DHX8/PRP22
LENHTGLRDKVLAEFIIDIARRSENEKDFKGKLDEVEADFTS